MIAHRKRSNMDILPYDEWLDSVLLTGEERTEILTSAMIEFFKKLDDPKERKKIKMERMRYFPHGIMSTDQDMECDSFVTDSTIGYFMRLLNTRKNITYTVAMDPLFFTLLINSGIEYRPVKKMIDNCFISSLDKKTMPDKIIFPYNFGRAHWVVAIAIPFYREVIWHDPYNVFKTVEKNIDYDEEVKMVFSKILNVMSYMYEQLGSLETEMSHMWTLQMGTITPSQYGNVRCGWYCMAISKICTYSYKETCRNITLTQDIEDIRNNIAEEIKYASSILNEDNFSYGGINSTLRACSFKFVKALLQFSDKGSTWKKHMVFKRIEGVSSEITDMSFILGMDYKERLIRACNHGPYKSMKPVESYSGYLVHTIPTILSSLRDNALLYKKTLDIRDVFNEFIKEMFDADTMGLVFTLSESGKSRFDPFHFLAMCTMIMVVLEVYLVDFPQYRGKDRYTAISNITLDVPVAVSYFKKIKRLGTVSFSGFACQSIVNEFMSCQKHCTIKDHDLPVEKLIKSISLLDMLMLFLHSGTLVYSEIKQMTITNDIQEMQEPNSKKIRINDVIVISDSESDSVSQSIKQKTYTSRKGDKVHIYVDTLCDFMADVYSL